MRAITLLVICGLLSCATTDEQAVDVATAFKNADQNFISQQKRAFPSETKTATAEREHRYIFGMNVRHQQLDSLLKKYKVAEKNDYEVEPKNVLFGVPSVVDQFSRHTLFHHKRGGGKQDGMMIDEVIAYLEKHTIDPEDVPIHVLLVNEQVIAINNIDLAVLALIDAQPEKIIKHSLEDLPGAGIDSIHEILSNLERMPNHAGSSTIFIRGKGVNISGDQVESYDWSAPFTRRAVRAVGSKSS